VLIAAVLGVALGCLASEGHLAARLAGAVPLLIGALAALLAGAYVALSRGLFRVALRDTAESGELFFGILPPARAYNGPRIPLELVLSLAVALLLALFAGLGRRLADAFSNGAEGDRAQLGDFALHVAGGLAGALAFCALSALGSPPWVWLGIAAPIAWVCAPPSDGGKGRARAHALVSAAALVFAVAIAWRLATPGEDWIRRFSPYYRVDLDPSSLALSVDGLGHQRFLGPDELARAAEQGGEDGVYALLHELRERAGRPPLEAELVIGAGGGNDVAAALAAGARRVDAVEIDPVIAELGREHHPARPYADPRARLFVDDGRAFLARRATPGAYDAVVYALVDSLASHGGYGSVRLENYLFTREAIEDVRAALAPDGVFALYNFYREPWLVRRLAELVRIAFEQEPIVLSLSDPADEARGRGLTVILAGHVEDLRAPARALADEGRVRVLRPEAGGGPVPTDDWPFPYLRERAVPPHELRMALFLVAAALAGFALLVPRAARGVGAPYFGLGVGFMLLQTTGVARLALLFGATWSASAVTVTLLFASSLLGTAVVARRGSARPAGTGGVRVGGWIAALLVFVAVAALMPLGPFAGGSLATRVLAAALVLFAPAACAGVLFADAFRRSPEPARALGSNLAGLVVGAVLAPVTALVGLRAALGIAAVAYALASRAVWRGRA